MRACMHARACVFYSLIGGKLYYWGEGGGSYIVVGKAWGKFIGLGGGGNLPLDLSWEWVKFDISELCNVRLQAA